jgi:hypothetical protein
MNYQIYEIDKNKPTHIIYKTNHKDKNSVADPILELYKGKLFSCLIKFFTNDCIEIFGNHIFSIKKSYSRTITNLLSSWIFSLYIDYDFSSDYFFPTNYHKTKSLEDTLRDFCKYDSKIVNIDYKISKVVTNLKNNYKYQLELLKSYSTSSLYINNKSNYRIKKTMMNIKKNKNEDNETTFYKFDIIVPFIIKDKRLQNILNNILIPVKVYDKMSNYYKGSKNKFDEILWCIVYRYQLLGSNNHQLAVLPTIMNKMTTDYNLNFECFASAINCTFPNFCSIYWDLERHFGSIGSFFNIVPIKGTFGFNPPYQKDIIELGIHKLFNFLNETTDNLTFIITIPIWDSHGKSVMKEIFNNELEKQNIDYGDFEIINEIKKSKYFRVIKMIPKEKFTYVDHNFELYKNKTIQNTYVIILSNSEINSKKLLNYNFELLNENDNNESVSSEEIEV